MSKLFIDEEALGFIKKALSRENAQAMRVFISGGGCCKLFELAPVEKALAGDITYRQSGVTVHIEKELVENTSTISIRFDEQKGLTIYFE